MNLEDLGIVLTELFVVKEKWFNIGLQLSVPVKDLQWIFSEHKNDHSTGLRLMLVKWLEMGEANWKSLSKALSSQIVEESALAKKVQQKYCTSTGLPGNKRPSGSKGTKRTHSEDSSAPNPKRSKTELPSSFAPEDFIRVQPGNRLCVKCRRVPRCPQRPNCCYHKVYCEPCSQKTKMCLTHRQDITYTVDKELQANVPKLHIHCPNRQRGCGFQDVLYKVYKEHLPACMKQRKGSRPHNITIIPSMEQHSGDRERSGTPTTPSTPLATPTTPLTTPITPVNSNPPSPMAMNRLKSSRSSSVPRSPIATQPPPGSPREKPKHAGQATVKEMLASEGLATSQVKQHIHAQSSKQPYQVVGKEMNTMFSQTSQKEQQQPSQAKASHTSSIGQGSSATTSRIAKITATECATVPTSAGISACSVSMTTQQATPTKALSQTSVTSSPIMKSTSAQAELTQSRNSSAANGVTTSTQAQAAKPQMVSPLSAAALTRQPLRHQKKSSTTDFVASQTLMNSKQPLKSTQAQSSVSASPVTTNVSMRNAQQSAYGTAGNQPLTTSSTLQQVLQQTRPVMSPTVTQSQPSTSMPNTSVGQVRNVQQNASKVAVMQAQNLLTSQALPHQQIPVMVGLEYPPTLQQLQTLAMMGVQLPTYNLPLILQHPNQQQSLAASISNSAACSQAVPTQSAAKQPEMSKTSGSTASKVTAQSKPRHNVTAVSSSINVSRNVAAMGAKGTDTSTDQKSHQETTKSVASSKTSTPTSEKSLRVTEVQSTVSVKSHTCTSAMHTNLTTAASEKSVTVAQITQSKSHTSAEHTKLTISTSEKSAPIEQRAPPKLRTQLKLTKNSLPSNSSSSQAQEVTYLFTESTSASLTPPVHTCTKSLPGSSNDSPVQRAVNSINTTPSSSKAATLMKSGGRSASKQAAQPMRYNGTPTSANSSTLQNVASSPKSIIQHVTQASLSVKKALSFSSSATISLNSAHNGLQTSSRVAENSPISTLKGTAPKTVAKTEKSSSTSSGGQKTHLPSLLCSVCQHTPRNPLRSECCGALYCEPCSRRVDMCPQHKCQLRFTRDAELFDVIQKQETKCKYAGNGCKWRGRVAEQKQHIMVCLYNPSRVQLESNVKKEDKNFIPSSDKASVGSKGLLPGSDMIIKKECTAEQKISSPKVTMEYQACDYEAIGCTEQVPRGKMKLHLQEAVQDHLDLAIKRILLDEMKQE